MSGGNTVTSLEHLQDEKTEEYHEMKGKESPILGENENENRNPSNKTSTRDRVKASMQACCIIA
eukprot:CAMPEP_0119049928 /NCGR_PEP_ID=MMETSP1177-20130426/67267_1 /TAXON_ID=2985 /ORGANISM="Ochromonas sp, Strain CCMP1899" /LENGTH=63 /DNA_ID=CAMNT_0007027737 /DNA_START=149 /DNA_END=340 /DNA_ORIENTATION=-